MRLEKVKEKGGGIIKYSVGVVVSCENLEVSLMYL